MQVSTAAMFLLIPAMLVVIWVWHDEVQELARHAVTQYGLPALFFLVWFFDATIQPIPPDVIVFGAGFGGARIVPAAFVAGFASSLAGVTGFYIGRAIGPKRFCRMFGRKILRMGGDLFKNYGSLAIFIASISPLPYSATCYVGGIYNMSPWKLFLTSLISRTARYLILAKLGQAL
jgi:undecaprenyl-diphosphatase